MFYNPPKTYSEPTELPFEIIDQEEEEDKEGADKE